MLVVGWRFNPPAPAGKDAPDASFSAERAAETMKEVFGEGPHPTGSRANEEVRGRLVAHLKRLGLEPTERRARGCNQFAICADVVNVIAELPGRSQDALLLVTHYDSVPAASGAADDGAGVAAVLEAVRALMTESERPLSVILLFTDGEELGLLGAKAFVAGHPAMTRVKTVINLEARGVGGPSLMFETSGPSALLVPHLKGLPRPVTSSLMDAVYKRLPNDTDFSAFRDAGKPGFNFAFIRGFARYHTPQDDFEHLDRGSLQHHGDNVLGLSRSLLAEPLADDGDDAVWFELLGWLWWWPRDWSMPLAVIAAALVLGAVARAFSTEESFFPRYMRALGAVLATLLLTLALAYGVVRLLHGRTTSLVPDHAHVGWALAAVSLGAITLGATLLRVTTRRCGPSAAQAAGWSLWALFGAIMSTELPAACHLFVVPTLLAGVAGVVVMRLPPGDPWRVHAMLLPQLVAVVLWGETLLGLVDTFNLVGAFAAGPLVGLWMAASASHWVPEADAPDETPGIRRVAGGMALVSLALAGVAYAQPVHDATHPQRMSIGYYQAEATAQWWVDASFGEVPEAVRKAGDLGAAGPSPHPFVSFVRASTGATESVGLAPPKLEVESVQGNVWRLRMRSARGARVLALMVPPGPKLDTATIDGQRVQPYVLADSPLFPGFRSIATATAPADGVPIVVDLGAGPPKAVLVMDITFELPATADALMSARGDAAFGSQNGDASIVVQRTPLKRPVDE